MVAILVRMKLAVLRHNLSGARLIQLSWGILFGLVAIIINYFISFFPDYQSLKAESDIHALLLIIWMFGWILGPTLFTGEDKTLIPEHFRFLPVSSQKLATGLLGASFLGVPVVISLLAFFVLVLYAIPLGVVPTLIALLAMLLHLIFVILLSRVVTSLLRDLTRSIFNTVLSSIFIGGIMAFFVTGWFIFEMDLSFLTNGFSQPVSTFIYAIPSSWGMVAINAVYQGNWLLTILALAGLVILILLLRSIWALLLVRRLTIKHTKSRISQRRNNQFKWITNPVRAVAYKELTTWARDYTRSGHMYFGFFYSVFLCLYPIAIGNYMALPWAGILFVITAIGATANLYGSDGSSLWMILTTPKAERYDIRGRQLAWLLIVGPITLLLTTVMILISDSYWTIPLAISVCMTALGIGGGLVVLNSVFRLEPMIDTHKRGDGMFDNPLNWWQFMSLIIFSIILLAPTVAILYLSFRFQIDWLKWTGIPFGLGLGIFYYWWFGRIAYKRLEERGPELLNIMLRGTTTKSTDKDEVDQTKASFENITKASFENVIKAMPSNKQIQFLVNIVLGLIALFPQGLVPLVIKLTGGGGPAWFLALYLPEAWQWPVIGVMITIGVLTFGGGTQLYFKYKHKWEQEN